MEVRKRVLKKYNLVNPYENIEILEKEQKPVLEPNKKEGPSEAEVDAEAGKNISGRLDSIANDLIDYNKKVLDFTEKYSQSFGKLITVLESPAEAGLKIE